jgi:hypothetical protein
MGYDNLHSKKWKSKGNSIRHHEVRRVKRQCQSYVMDFLSDFQQKYKIYQKYQESEILYFLPWTISIYSQQHDDFDSSITRNDR